MTGALRSRSSRRAGRVVPAHAQALRGRVIVLKPGGSMEWHSTNAREELLIALEGRVVLEVGESARARRTALRAGDTVFVPSRTRHRVVNAARGRSRYLYVTAGR